MKTKNPAHVANFPPELPPRRRYTLGGDEVAESQVEQDLARLAADTEGELRDTLVALILVGRFARGEGGVVRRQGEPHAAPSYRCLAIVDVMTPGVGRRVAALSKVWTHQLGVPVHIHPHGFRLLDRARPTLWWLDVARGNSEILCGDRNALLRLQGLDVADLAADESGWLLSRACAQLALAWIAARPDPIAINHALHLLALACGDASLLLSGRFGATLRSRETQLAGLGMPTERVSAYHGAAAYLGAPEAGPTPGLSALASRTALLSRFHLEIEQGRSGVSARVDRIMRSRTRLFARPKAQLLRPSSWLQALARQDASYPYVADPRERLARAAIGLAYQHQDPGCRLLAARLLQTGGDRTAEGLSSALAALLDSATGLFPDAVDAGFYD